MATGKAAVATVAEEVAVDEKTDAELVAEEVARIQARNDEAKAKLDEEAKKGVSPLPAKVDETAQALATKAAEDAISRVMRLDQEKIDGIISMRPRSIVLDVYAILNMYSNAAYCKITRGEDGKVTIVI